MSGNPEPLSYFEAQQRLREAAQKIRDAEQSHRDRIEAAGEAIAAHKKALHTAMIRLRGEGKGITEAELLAKSSVGDLEAKAFVAMQLVKADADSIENRRGDRASLHRLVEFSMKLSLTGEQHEQSGVPTVYGRRAA